MSDPRVLILIAPPPCLSHLPYLEGGPASHEAFAALPRTQNGTATVLLPALGLGTCWLTPSQTYDAVREQEMNSVFSLSLCLPFATPKS